MLSHFLSLSPRTYRLRGLTRNPSSPASQALISKGVEMVAANLNDASSVQRAFEGAHAIFGTTDFASAYSDPQTKAKAKEQGIPSNEQAYYVEMQQGRSPILSSITLKC